MSNGDNVITVHIIWYFFLSPTSDGSAAVILASEDFVRKHNLKGQAVEIIGMEMSTDTPSTFGRSCISLVSRFVHTYPYWLHISCFKMFLS